MIIRTKARLRISFAGGGTDITPYPFTLIYLIGKE